MKKKFLSILLLLSIFLSMVNLIGIIPVGAVDTEDLRGEIAAAKPLIYRGYSEQSRKYLADRIDRAEALACDPFATEEEVAAALSELSAAVDALSSMAAVEEIKLNGFEVWNEEILATMSGSSSTPVINSESKPEGTTHAISVSGKGSVVFTNAVTETAVVGETPFGKDMLKADGIKVWLGITSPATFEISIGYLADQGSCIYTVSDVNVREIGYVYLPFDRFVSDSSASLAKDGSLNYLSIKAIGVDGFDVAGFGAYNEILESSNKTPYSETKIMGRGEIEDNAYYKIIEATSGKAITLGPEVPENWYMWDKTIGIEHPGSLSFTLEENKEGDRTQMWQLSPSPSGNGTYRLINKSSTNAIEIYTNGANITHKAPNLNTTYQEWVVSASAGKFTLQVKGVGRLTTAGDTVKATTGNTYKKFYLYKVVETEYVQSWSDEFDGTELDRTKWNVVDGYSDGAIYPDEEDILKVEDGNLVSIGKTQRYDAYELVGTYMNTSGKFAFGYGKIEVRAKLAHGTGQFPAFWLMPSDMMNHGAGEVDILEMVVKGDISNNGDIIGTVHWVNDDGTDDLAKVHYLHIDDYGNKFLSDDYHTFGLEMDRDMIRYYYDGMQYMSLLYNTDGKKYAFGDTARYIVFNNTPRGETDNGMGNTVNESWNVPEEYKIQVDYIKVFLENGEMTDTTVDYTTEESTNYSEGLDIVATNAYWDINLPTDISPDGNEGAAADHMGKVYIFDPNTNTTERVLQINPLERALRVLYSPDGTKLVVATTQGCVFIFDTSDYTKAPLRICNGAVIQENVLFTPDSKQLIIGGFNGGSQKYRNPIDSKVSNKWCFRVYDSETGSEMKEVYVGSDPRYIALSDDGSKLAVGTTSNGMFVYNTSDWSEIFSDKEHHNGAIRGADFTSDGKLLVTSDDKGVINVWDVEAKTLRNVVNNVNTGSVRRIIFSPDDKNILTTSTYGAARLYDAASGELISLLGGFGNVIREVAYSPDGKYIVIAAYEGGAKVFSADGTYLQSLKAGETDRNKEGYIISFIRFSPDSEYVYFASRTYPNSLQKWKLPSEVDKTLLNNAISAADPSSEGYEYAVKVANLKYASFEAVSKAYYDLVGGKATVDSAVVSNDGYEFADTISILKNGAVYFKSALSADYRNIAVKITNTDTNEESVILLDHDTLLYEKLSADYASVERFVKLVLTEGGNYKISLVDTVENLEFAAVTVTVDGTKSTTQDFLYSVNDGEVTIISGISGEKDVVIPEMIEGYPVTVIGAYAFYGYGRVVTPMTLELPDTIKRIENYAFSGCCSLRSVELPDSLKYIGSYAFADCMLLGEIEIPDDVEIASNGLKQTGAGTITVGSNITMPSSANAGNPRVRELIIKEGVETTNINLGTQYLIEAIYVPESVTSLPQTLFYSNRKIVTIYGIPGSYAETYAAQYPQKYKFVAIVAPVITGVEEGATYDLYTLENKLLPDWDAGYEATLNGEKYRKGHAITEPGEYTLTVVNGYDKYSTTVKFTVVDTTPPPYTLGDMDNDGEISVADALAILRIVAKLAVPEGEQNLIADINKDGVIAVDDALAVLRYVAKLTDSLE